MGITVLSAPATSTASTVGTIAQSAALAVDVIPIDFATLLTGQIAGLPATASSAAITTQGQEKSKEDGDKGDELIENMLLVQDPSQTAQNVTPNISPVLENRLQIDVDRNSQASPTAQTGVALAGDAQISAQDAASIAATIKGIPQESTAPIAANIAQGFQSQPKSIKQALETTTNTQTNATSSLISTPTSSIQANQPSIPTTTQTTNSVPANLAVESNTANTTPSTFATMLAAQTGPAQHAQPATPTSPPTVTTPLQDSHWAQDFSERIVWVAKNDQQVAQINITPAQLGPVQITLNMNGDQASITFASPHAEVRKAIEDAMPNLREMLSTTGISLGQSNVGAQLQQQQRDTSPQFTNGNRSAGETAILPADNRSGSISTGLPIQRGRGLVDLFA